MLSPSDVILLEVEGFDVADIQGNTELFEELLKVLGQDDARDRLLVDVSFVLQVMHDDYGMAIVDALKWVLAFSEHLDTEPIRYLVQSGFLLGRDRVILAADAYTRAIPAAQWRIDRPDPDLAVVLPFRPRLATVRRIH